MQNKLISEIQYYSFAGLPVKKSILNIIIYLTFFLFIVIPNALRIFKLPFLFLLLVFAISNTKLPKRQLTFFFLLILVTYIFILVGKNKTIDFQTASVQAFIVYVIFPIIWIVIGNFIFKIYDYKVIVKKYIQIGLWGCLSVYIAYAAFIMGYGDFVKILVERPNALITGNVFSITLNVFGSLLVIAAAIGHVPKLYSQRRFIVLLVVYVLTAAISGRSAFILAAAIGVFFFVIYDKRLLKNSFFIFLGFAILAAILFYFNLELMGSIEHFIEELLSGGGDERTKQTKMLTEGILDTYFLGAGHGVGIKYIRNYEFPWRYENLIFSIIYRTGIIGLLIYAYPFIYSLLSFLRLKKKRMVNMYDKFFFWGVTVFILVNFTNPYLESFEFQIPYFFTYCYFFNRSKNLVNENINTSEIRS